MTPNVNHFAELARLLAMAHFENHSDEFLRLPARIAEQRFHL